MSPTTIPGKMTLRGPTAAPLLLDSYSGAAVAYSLRQLSWAYGGPVVRVRRDNNNAEQDFTAAEVSDGTLATWVGAGNNGFVRTWYDQSGNGRDVIQTSAANQPLIVSGGSVLLENSKPTISLDGINDYLRNSAYTQVGVSAVSVFCVIQTPVDSATKIINFGYTFTPNQAAFIRFNDTDSNYLFGALEGRYDATNNFINGARGGVPTTNQILTTALTTGTLNTGFVNNVQIGQTALTAPLDFGSILEIGRLATGYGAMKPQELVIYHADQSANRAAIEANINAHYNIYP